MEITIPQGSWHSDEHMSITGEIGGKGSSLQVHLGACKVELCHMVATCFLFPVGELQKEMD